MFSREPPLPNKIGFGSDFYQTSGANRTNYSVAIQAALKSKSWMGLPCGLWRTQTLDATEVNKSWAESAFSDISSYLGTFGAHVSVVADKLILTTDPYTEDLAMNQVDTVMAGRAAASRQCIQIFQIGNEPYIGASGTHAELNSTLADRAIALGKSIKAKYPTVKLALPALGTFQGASLQACKDDLDTNWAQMVSLFIGHDRTFDYAAANCYRSTVDGTDALIIYGAAALKTNAALLNCEPIITELGLVNPDPVELAASLVAAGTDLPRIIWKVGAGDSFDLLATGAITEAGYPTPL